MIRTWHIELAVVATILAAVALVTDPGVIELVGAAAVTLSFAHAQVADRLAEAERERRAYVKFADGNTDRHAVDCHRWAARYMVSKESLWLAYFVAHRSWSALAGVALFLAYAPWRRWWRARGAAG